MRSNACLLVLATSVACGPDPGKPPTDNGGSGGATGGSGGNAGTGGNGANGGTLANGGNSSGAGGSAAGTAAGTGGSGGGTGGVAAGTGGAGGTAGVGTVVLPASGRVEFGSLIHFPNPDVIGTVAEAFFHREGVYPASACTTTTFGQCSVTTCPDPYPPYPVLPPDTRPTPTAGLITVRTDGQFILDLEPDEGSYYRAESVGTFLGEESITVTAAGADVPAFTTTMTYPLYLLLTEPMYAEGQVEHIARRDQDLVLRWDRGVAGTVLLVESEVSAADLACSVPAESGTLTIEAAALTQLTPGADLLLYGVTTNVVSAGDYAVSVSAVGNVLTPDKTRRAAIVLE